MSGFLRYARLGSGVLIALVLQACSHTPAPPPAPPTVAIAPPPPVSVIPAPKPVRVVRARRRHKHRGAAVKPADQQAAAVVVPAPVTATPAEDASVPTPSERSRASQLRAAGLEQLNRGAVGPAVALLQQASVLDPQNAVIRRDLGRAIRISKAVGS